MKDQEREGFREAGRIACAAREHARSLIRPGTLLKDVVEACEAKIRELGGQPAFPAQISRNHIAAHYCPPPDDVTRVEAGDIIKLDCGVHVDGYVADNAVTVDLRDGDASALSMASRVALENVIAIAGPGVSISELGRTIHDTITSLGFKPVFNLTGHGVARWKVHCAPQIPNYDDKRVGRLQKDQVIAVEPFASDGKGFIEEVGKAEVFMQTRAAKPKDKLDDALGEALAAFRMLPFARRDLLRLLGPDRVEAALLQLRRRRLIHEYPPLCEAPGVRISQHEHTLLVTEDGVEVLTRAG
ncbi:MAG: type II methionyl aminopeptidase [Planctomycetota bacterium]